MLIILSELQIGCMLLKVTFMRKSMIAFVFVGLSDFGAIRKYKIERIWFARYIYLKWSLAILIEIEIAKVKQS